MNQRKMGKNNHIPVLLKEVNEILDPQKGKRIIDATLGTGGHTLGFLKEGAEVLGIDWDPEILLLAKERLKACPGASWQAVCGNFAQIEEIARKNNFFPVDGILFDLGVSRWHLKKGKRGFSFEDQSLDMRLSPSLKLKAVDIINHFQPEELVELFTSLVQEGLAKPIAEAIVRVRRIRPITTARELSGLIEKVYQKEKVKRGRIQPATKIFLGLRMRVNQELDNLISGLKGSLKILKNKGRLAVISFHSGEDRLVKLFLKGKERQGELRLLTRKPVPPSPEERAENPSARSAVLRGAEKCE